MKRDASNHAIGKSKKGVSSATHSLKDIEEASGDTSTSNKQTSKDVQSVDNEIVSPAITEANVHHEKGDEIEIISQTVTDEKNIMKMSFSMDMLCKTEKMMVEELEVNSIIIC